MTKIIIGPLGWTNSIWYKLDLSHVDYVINFENINVSIEELLEKTYKILKKYDDIEFYTFSFGGVFLLKLIETYPEFHTSISKIFFFDSLYNPTKVSLSSIEEGRKINFNSEQEIYSNYLNDEEMLDIDKKDLIIKQFIKKDDIYTHFMNNESFYKYLNVEISDMFIFLRYNINYEIYSSIDLPEVKYYKVDDSDHLMMLEKSDLVQKIINQN